MLKSTLKTSIYLSILLIPFYFFRFSILGIKTNVFEVSVLICLILEIIVIAKSSKRLKQFLMIDRHGLQPRDDKTMASGNGKWFLPCLFLLIAFVAAILSPDKTAALGIFKGYFLVPIILAWVVSKNIKKEEIWKLSIPLFIPLILISIWAILQKAGFITTLFYQDADPSFDQYISQGRVFGPFESPNFLAMYLAPVMFLTLPIVEKLRSRIKKSIFLLVYILPILALNFTGSRGGIIAFVIGLLVYLNYRFINLQKAESRRPFYAGLFTSLFVLINMLYLFYSIRIASLVSDSDKFRVEIYRHSLQLLKNNYFCGIGLANFQNKLAALSSLTPAFRESGLPYALHPHNLFLAVWLNLGLLGIAVFLWLLVSFFKAVFSIDGPMRAVLVAAMIAILVHGLFDTTYFKNDLSAILWLIFALTFILLKIEKHD